jgi:hypothetical protein
MPAKVGPKRVRALALAGCYFDGTAARRAQDEGFDLRKSAMTADGPPHKSIRVL